MIVAVELNVHIAVDDKNPKKVARIFASAGWSMRKSGWRDYEIESEKANLIVEAQQPVLVHGLSTRAGFDDILTILRSAGLRYAAELYEESECISSEQA